jgi:hypothetical protein
MQLLHDAEMSHGVLLCYVISWFNFFENKKSSF